MIFKRLRARLRHRWNRERHRRLTEQTHEAIEARRREGPFVPTTPRPVELPPNPVTPAADPYSAWTHGHPGVEYKSRCPACRDRL